MSLGKLNDIAFIVLHIVMLYMLSLTQRIVSIHYTVHFGTSREVNVYCKGKCQTRVNDLFVNTFGEV